jgi:hypothetical protein
MEPRKIIAEWRARSVESDSEAALSDPEFREKVYAELHPSPTVDDRDLLLHLLSLEMGYRSDESNSGDYFENLYWCGLLIHQLGETKDALSLWRAKHVNFDTGCGFDIQFLVGAGVEPTLTFLSTSDEPDATDARDYIVECREAGDFDDLEDWLAGRIAYYN